MAETKEQRRARTLRKEYSLTLPEYDQMLRDCGGVCEICGGVCNKLLSVDHDKKTGRVRGLLCRHCNLGLGHFFDSVESLTSAIEYLKKNK